MADKNVTVKPSGGTYTSLAAAIAGELSANANLVTMEGILHIKIEGDWSGGPDTTLAEVNNFTTSADYYIHIYADSANRAKLSGWDTSRYILAVSNPGTGALYLRDEYVDVDGLQISTPAVNANGQSAIYLGSVAATNNRTRLSNLRLKGANDETYRNHGISGNDSDIVLSGWNIIAEDFSPSVTGSYGFSVTGAPANLYNCLAYNCRGGYYKAGGTVNIYDSVALNCTDDFAGTPDVIDYCASDDGDGTNDVTEDGGGADWTGDFTDGSAGDWTLLTDSGLKGAAGAAGSAIFSTDMDGNARDDWSVGPAEYVSSGVNVALTGVSGTASVGTLALSLALVLTGLAGTGAVGTMAPSADMPISGIEAPASPSTMSPAMAAVMAGVEAVNSTGSAGVSVTIPITGSEATSAVGTMTPGSGVGPDITIPITGVSSGISYPLSGEEATGGVGTVTAVSTYDDITLPVTGVIGTGAVGSITYFEGPGGEAMTGEVGDVAPTVAPPLTGNEATAAVGGVGQDRTAGLNGVAGTGAAGGWNTISRPLTGVAGTGAVGTLTPTRSKAITGNAAVGRVMASSASRLATQRSVAPVGVTGTGRAGYLDTLMAGDVIRPLTGVAGAGAVGGLSCLAPTPILIDVHPRKRIHDVQPRKRIIDVGRRRR